MTHRLNVMHAPIKFHEFIPSSHVMHAPIRSYGPDTVYYMELSQGEIIQKPKMQEFSSLLMTHLLSVMHALVKFHEYISYGLGVMARTQLTVWT